jgi:hypothetical protein
LQDSRGGGSHDLLRDPPLLAAELKRSRADAPAGPLRGLSMATQASGKRQKHWVLYFRSDWYCVEGDFKSIKKWWCGFLIKKQLFYFFELKIISFLFRRVK